jgi:hypothetical protein
VRAATQAIDCNGQKSLSILLICHRQRSKCLTAQYSIIARQTERARAQASEHRTPRDGTRRGAHTGKCQRAPRLEICNSIFDERKRETTRHSGLQKAFYQLVSMFHHITLGYTFMTNIWACSGLLAQILQYFCKSHNCARLNNYRVLSYMS